MGLLLGPIGLAMGWFVYRAAPRRSQNRRLAVLLVLMEAGAFWGIGIVYVSADYASAYATQVLFIACAFAIIIAYLFFLATIESPLTTWLRSRATTWALWTLILAGQTLIVFRPGLFLSGLEPTWYSRWEYVPTPASDILFFANAMAAVFGFFVALTAFRIAPPRSAARSRAKAYAIAFGIHDLLIFIILLTTLNSTPGRNLVLDTVLIQGFGLTQLLFVLLLTYGILRTQLFGIDLKVKWAVRRGAVLAALAALFFTVKESIEFLLPLHGLLASLTGAAIVALLVYPIWRGSARLAERVMPGVEDTPQYRKARSQEIYRAALEELAVGGLTEKERRTLNVLRTKLDITEEEAKKAAFGVT